MVVYLRGGRKPLCALAKGVSFPPGKSFLPLRYHEEANGAAAEFGEYGAGELKDAAAPAFAVGAFQRKQGVVAGLAAVAEGEGAGGPVKEAQTGCGVKRPQKVAGKKNARVVFLRGMRGKGRTQMLFPEVGIKGRKRAQPRQRR